jgi:phosphopantothenoylcysteine decarboxylase/phosphopantothenate--cysteine ligase
MRPFDDRRVLLFVSGGIAAYKSAFLLRKLTQVGATVDVVMTASAEKMIGSATFEALSGRPVHTDLWRRPLAHVELGRDADLAVVAPATANIIGRMAGGLADDMATSTLLAAACPILVCPAMNGRMWENEATQANVKALLARGIEMVGPEYGPLAEGEEGLGRMAEPERILAEIGRHLETSGPLEGRRVVVTAGPTRAPLDPVRYVGNRSSGRMGYAIAASAWRRGADVILISGPASSPLPYGPRTVLVETAGEMLEALTGALVPGCVLVMAAAVSDFEVDSPREAKIKKTTGGLSLDLRNAPDVLTETRDRREELGVFTIGFALETHDLVVNAIDKLERKGMDLVVLNQAGRVGEGLEAATNRVTIIDTDGIQEELPLLLKEEVADRLLDRLEDRLVA